VAMVTWRAFDHRRVGARSQCSLSQAADSPTHPGPAEILSIFRLRPLACSYRAAIIGARLQGEKYSGVVGQGSPTNLPAHDY